MMYRDDYKFRIKQSLITPQVEAQLQRLRDINIEIIIEPEDSMAMYGGIMKEDNTDTKGDWYPPDVYEILIPLYAELFQI
jgi:hypothetical protein